MSLESVLREVEELSEAEKQTVLQVLQEHFEREDYALTEDDIRMARSRLERYREHPETGVSLAEMKQRHGL